MSASRRVSVGRWMWGLAGFCCVAVVLGMAWRTGTINPVDWLLGPRRAPAVAQSRSTAKKAEWVLPQELIEAQTEPEIETEGDSESIEPGPTKDDAGREGRATTRFSDASEDEPGEVKAAVFEEEQAETSAVPVRSAKRDVVPVPIDGDAAGHSRPLMELAQIEALEQDGDLIAAQRELSQWYWRKPESRNQLLPQLHRMARALYFSPQPQFYEPYVVQPSDQLRVIGQKHKLSWEYLSKLNNVDAKKIRAGQKLKVVPGPFAAYVSISDYELVIHLNGSFVKSYRVGVGKDGLTPLGSFTVKNKMVDPTYYGPEGVIAHDDPQNPLGERWIDIGDGFGIHGTIEPDSIGRNESRGCIRLLNPDVAEVYDFLVVGSEVKIRR